MFSSGETSGIRWRRSIFRRALTERETRDAVGTKWNWMNRRICLRKLTRASRVNDRARGGKKGRKRRQRGGEERKRDRYVGFARATAQEKHDLITVRKWSFSCGAKKRKKKKKKHLAAERTACRAGNPDVSAIKEFTAHGPRVMSVYLDANAPARASSTAPIGAARQVDRWRGLRCCECNECANNACVEIIARWFQDEIARGDAPHRNCSAGRMNYARVPFDKNAITGFFFILS